MENLNEILQILTACGVVVLLILFVRLSWTMEMVSKEFDTKK